MGTSSAYIFSVCVLVIKCSVNPMFPSKWVSPAVVEKKVTIKLSCWEGRKEGTGTTNDDNSLAKTHRKTTKTRQKQRKQDKNKTKTRNKPRNLGAKFRHNELWYSRAKPTGKQPKQDKNKKQAKKSWCKIRCAFFLHHTVVVTLRTLCVCPPSLPFPSRWAYRVTPFPILWNAFPYFA